MKYQVLGHIQHNRKHIESGVVDLSRPESELVKMGILKPVKDSANKTSKKGGKKDAKK